MEMDSPQTFRLLGMPAGLVLEELRRLIEEYGAVMKNRRVQGGIFRANTTPARASPAATG
jgi:hypothetical protein